MYSRKISSIVLILSMVSAFAAWAVQADDVKPSGSGKATASGAKSSSLDRIKSLAGEWVLADKPNDPPHCTYRVVSGGTAVMEELMPAGEENMITMYHLDGDALVMTHYCGLGNQPRMKAKPMVGNKLAFEFTGGCNVQRDGKYMSALTLEFIDADHIKASWTLADKGKIGEHVTFDLIRKKKA